MNGHKCLCMIKLLHSPKKPLESPNTAGRQKSLLPTYEIPEKFEDLIKKDNVPAVLRKPLSPSTYKDYFATLLYSEDYHLEVLISVSKTNPILLYIRNVEEFLFRSQRIYTLFRKMLSKLSGPILFLGSRMLDPGNDYRDVDERLTLLFPYNIEIKPPEDETHLLNWKSQLEEDMKVIQFRDNRNHIMEVKSYICVFMCLTHKRIQELTLFCMLRSIQGHDSAKNNHLVTSLLLSSGFWSDYLSSMGTSAIRGLPKWGLLLPQSEFY
ncbi:uncharacterized protein LOC131255941 [Magnolia sinica]|uniref:uncharacterized protein LOC131255941 n=1 Tax=Magnolia sinica TaxID=86752 RepID=UPI002657B3CF|nr:uncharacterized protein LOC131255941 [Magnolia sinica]